MTNNQDMILLIFTSPPGAFFGGRLSFSCFLQDVVYRYMHKCNYDFHRIEYQP